MNDSNYFLPAQDWRATADLPATWGGGPAAWPYYQQLELHNPTRIDRPHEPLAVDVDLYRQQSSAPERELRVFEVVADAGPLREVPSQVHADGAGGEVRHCRVYFLADIGADTRKTYLFFYGNPDAEAPRYETDLQVTGEGYALQIENSHYRIELAPTNGHLKSVAFVQGQAAFCGFGPPMSPGTVGSGRHGVEGSVHWNPDWSDGQLGRYRVTNWPRPPHYDVLRGPVCVRVERSGHPILGLGPHVGQAHKVMAHIVYTFFAESPYFLMESRLEALEDVRFRDCRNDEWVDMAPSMPAAAWMIDGEIGFGKQSWQRRDPEWLSFYNEDNGDAFATLRLAYECTHPHFSEPAATAILDRAWVRYPVRNAILRRGDYIHEHNAYLVHRYEPGRHSGFGMLTDHHQRLRQPLTQLETPAPRRPLSVASVHDALRTCRDLELYVHGEYDSARTPSFVDLGLIRDVRVEGAVVQVALVLPYEGRQTWLEWFVETITAAIAVRVAGVDEVRVEQVHEPVWSPQQIESAARHRMGL